MAVVINNHAGGRATALRREYSKSGSRCNREPARGAITDLGEFSRRKDHAPDEFTCHPKRIQLACRTNGVTREWLFAAGASKANIPEI